MWSIFKHKLLNNWLVILGWGIGLGFLGYFMIDIYETFIEQNIDLAEMMAVIPAEFMTFFGGNADLTSPEGFLTIEFFSYIPVILGILIISHATSLITGEEEEGTLELVIAQPISRTAVFWSKVSALVISLVLILAITWMGFVIGVIFSESFELSLGDLLNPFISLFALLLYFLGLSLLLSMILPSSKSASFVTVLFLISGYFVTSLSMIEKRLEVINLFSPLRYYQTGEALSGLKSGYLLILFYYAIIYILLAWFVFVKRDLHFGITGGLRIAVPGLHKTEK